MKKMKALLISGFILMFVIILSSCDNKKTSTTVPTYEGMVIQTNKINKKSRKQKMSNSTSSEEDDVINEEELTQEELEKDIEEIVSIDVIAGEEVEYFVSPGETFTLIIKLSNPDNFEIQSFTLNGNKYANYMFEDNSDMENLYLKVEAPTNGGYTEYTIDAIKYIDGTEIKDVDLSSGEKTIKAGVLHKQSPLATIVTSSVNTTSANFKINITDDLGLIGENPLKFFVTDGENTIYSQDLLIGDNQIEVNNLKQSKLYQFAVVTAYDLCDGKGNQSFVILKDTFETKNIFEIKTINITNEEIDFEIIKNDENGEIKSIDLFDKDNLTFIKSIDNLEKLQFTNLLSNHSYIIKLNFTYTSDETIDDNIYLEFKTQEKEIPTVEIINIVSTQTEINFDLKINDVNNILEIKSIDLLLNNNIVETKLFDGLSYKFEGLTLNTKYEIKVNSTYNLNDGIGNVEYIIETEYPTCAQNVGVEEIVVLNEGVVKVGEEMNLRIYFDNPNEILLTGIYVNNQLVEVVGGNKTSNAIIKFIPETSGGYFDFYVDKVKYISHEVEITQVVNSDISTTYPIYGELQDIEFTAISRSAYEYTDDYILVEFDNSEAGYVVKSINNGDTEFNKLGEGKYFVYSNYINSIEYGYDVYGITSQKFDFNFSKKYVESGVKYINNISDFKNITGSGYYKLMTNLDFRKESGINQINFNGILDGNGYTITGITMVKEDVSIFGTIGLFTGGTIYDLKLNETYISYKSNSNLNADASLIGGAIAYNCEIEGDMFITYKNGYVNFNTFDPSNKVVVSYTNNSETIEIKQSSTLKEVDNKVVYKDNAYYFDLGDNQYALFAVDNVSEIKIIEECEIILSNSICNENIKYVYIPKTVTIINNFAIYQENENDEKLLMIESVDGNSFAENWTNVIPNNIIYNSKEHKYNDEYEYITLNDGNYILIKALTKNENVEVNEIDGCKPMRIYKNAFIDNTNLKTVHLMDGIITIDENAFYGCINIREFYMPESVINYNLNMLENCINLEALQAPSDVFNYVYKNNLIDVIINSGQINVSFSKANNLKTVCLKQGVTSIGSSAFIGCSNLKEVIIEEESQLISIGDAAFYSCSSLESIKIPTRVTSIGDMAFHSCSSLESIKIPTGVTNIGSAAFSGCSNLTSIKIPTGVTSIGDQTFFCCSNLKEVIIEEGSKLTSIGDAAFHSCSSLESIKIPTGVTSIGDTAFCDCRNLKEVIIEEGSELTSIGDWAFHSCSSLESIKIPTGVTSIGDTAFSDCRNLKEVIIEEGSELTSIGENAFTNCFELQKVYYNGTQEQWNKITIEEGNDQLKNATLIFQ